MNDLRDPIALILAWLPWYAFGIVAEVPVFVVLGRILTRRVVDHPSLLRLAIAGAVGTMITHPLFVFVWPHVATSYLCWAISGELIIVVVEMFTFKLVAGRIPLWKAGLCSLAANSFSMLAGLLFQ